MRLIRGSDLPFVPASHENPKNPGVLKRVLATRDDLLAGRVQMLNWARLPAGRSFQLHYHEDMQEVFVIVAGQAQMSVGDETMALGPGDAIIVDPREAHQMEAEPTEDVDYLVFGITLDQGGKTVVV